MQRILKPILILNAVLLVWNLLAASGSAQRPPQANPDGIPFFNVNINPTDVPPMVNVNPNGYVPKVEVSRMPEVRIEVAGCDTSANFQTSVGRSISGPLTVTYLNVPPDTETQLSDNGNSRPVTFGNVSQLSTAIYLRSGQRLDFAKDVIFSGCRPRN
jgi:hypothetical protein